MHRTVKSLRPMLPASRSLGKGKGKGKVGALNEHHATKAYWGVEV